MELINLCMDMKVFDASKTRELNNCVCFIFLYELLSPHVMVSRDGSPTILSE